MIGGCRPMMFWPLPRQLPGHRSGTSLAVADDTKLIEENTLKALNIASGIAALIAAALWFISARARVKYTPVVDQSGFTAASITAGDTDVLASIKRANLWSMWAAIAAGVSALCQSIVSLAN